MCVRVDDAKSIRDKAEALLDERKAAKQPVFAQPNLVSVCSRQQRNPLARRVVWMADGIRITVR